mmetsp:Transcript_21210/g.55167  ORF Transcript_21210/g.55167 Transcript_21210/m.55167 type:complete len:709 (-) Transcript_21210:362-2488(-)
MKGIAVAFCLLAAAGYASAMCTAGVAMSWGDSVTSHFTTGELAYQALQGMLNNTQYAIPSDQTVEGSIGAINTLLNNNCSTIFITGVNGPGAILSVGAANHPNTKFVLLEYGVSSMQQGSNIMSVLFRQDELGYLAGFYFGSYLSQVVKPSGNSLVGVVVGPQTDASALRYSNGFVNGLATACSTCYAYVVNVESEYNATGGFPIANTLVNDYSVDGVFVMAGKTGLGVAEEVFNLKGTEYPVVTQGSSNNANDVVLDLNLNLQMAVQLGLNSFDATKVQVLNLANNGVTYTGSVVATNLARAPANLLAEMFVSTGVQPWSGVLYTTAKYDNALISESEINTFAGSCAIGVLFADSDSPTDPYSLSAKVVAQAKTMVAGGVQYEVPAGSSLIDHSVAVGKLFSAKCGQIIAVGPTGATTVTAVARAFPSMKFTVIGAGVTNAPSNVHSIIFRDDELGYLAGAYAGSMVMSAESMTVGVILPPASPTAYRIGNGFIAGMKKACRSCIADVYYVKDLASASEGDLIAQNMVNNRRVGAVFAWAGLTGVTALHEVINLAGASIPIVGEVSSNNAQFLDVSVENNIAAAVEAGLKGSFTTTYGTTTILPGTNWFSLANGGVQYNVYSSANVAVMNQFATKLATMSYSSGVSPWSGLVDGTISLQGAFNVIEALTPTASPSPSSYPSSSSGQTGGVVNLATTIFKWLVAAFGG